MQKSWTGHALRALQAGLLGLSLVAMNLAPLTNALAQGPNDQGQSESAGNSANNDAAPSNDPGSKDKDKDKTDDTGDTAGDTTDTGDDVTGETGETGETGDEGGSVLGDAISDVLEAVVNTVNVPEEPTDLSITIMKEFGPDTEGDCTDFSFQVEKANKLVISLPFDDDCTVTVPVDKAGAYVVSETSTTGFDVSYHDNVDPNNESKDGCLLNIDPGQNPEGFCTITNTVAEEVPAPLSCTLVSDDEDTYIGFVPATATFEHDAWSDELDGDGAEWIWNAFYVNDPTVLETVTFTRSFNVTGSPGTATLQIGSDNVHMVDVNGTPLSCGGGTDPNHVTVGGDNTCTIPVVSGLNTITFTVTNGGTPEDPDPTHNPAGLYYKITVPEASCTDVPPEPPVQTSSVTMCKMSDSPEESSPGLPGWTLYLKGQNVQTGLSVPSTNPSGADSNPLVAGMNYLATAMGTWSNQGGANLVDAEYSTTDGWTTHMDGYDGYQTDILELQINSAFDPNSDWGPYSSAHAYSQIFSQGSDGPANFRIFDGTGTTQNEGWFGDNSGSLSVDIDEVYSGTTEGDGCVTIEDVPYGTYTAGEIAQEGWTLVGIESGAEGSSVDGSTVVVDSPTEAFNVINHEDGGETPGQCVINSDSTTIEGGSASFELLEPLHDAWTAVMDAAAKWIWGDSEVVNPTGVTTQTFTKAFTLDSVPVTGGSLEIAADNQYTVVMNGTTIVTDTDENNFGTTETVIIPAANLIAGNNVLEITVTNMAMEGGTADSNPAGLRYRLTIDGASCTEIPPAPTYLKVHILKYLSVDEVETQVADNSGHPSFPMTASWDAANIGAGSGSYVLGNAHGGAPYQYAADTSPMQAPADYATAETTGEGSDVIEAGGTCVADKYRLVGYRTGATLEAAENAELSTVAPSFVDLTSDQYVIVVNEDCDDVLNDEPTDPPTPTNETIVVSPTDMNGWDIANFDTTDFSDDETTTTLGTKGVFVTGPATPPLGTGSFEQTIGPDGDEADRIRTSAYDGVDLADIQQLEYSSYQQSFVSGQATYLVLRIDQDGNGSTDDRLFFEPVYQNGTYSMVAGAGAIPNQGDVVLNTWQTWDADAGGWWSEDAGTFGPPLDTLAHYIADHPGAKLATDAPSVRLQAGGGAGAWDNFLGNMDEFIIRVNDGVTDHTTTFDFEPTATESTDNNGGGGGGGGGSSNRNNNNNNNGEVLGASTNSEGEVLGNECTLLTDYMREYMANNPAQVVLLQAFLNGEMMSGLPTTGFFGPLTTAAVNAFQLKYWEEVLKPWADIGMGENHTPTGYVYKTTLWKINDIKCPDLDVPFPMLP